MLGDSEKDAKIRKPLESTESSQAAVQPLVDGDSVDRILSEFLSRIDAVTLDSGAAVAGEAADLDSLVSAILLPEDEVTPRRDSGAALLVDAEPMGVRAPAEKIAQQHAVSAGPGLEGAGLEMSVRTAAGEVGNSSRVAPASAASTAPDGPAESAAGDSPQPEESTDATPETIELEAIVKETLDKLAGLGKPTNVVPLARTAAVADRAGQSAAGVSLPPPKSAGPAPGGVEFDPAIEETLNGLDRLQKTPRAVYVVPERKESGDPAQSPAAPKPSEKPEPDIAASVSEPEVAADVGAAGRPVAKPDRSVAAYATGQSVLGLGLSSAGQDPVFDSARLILNRRNRTLFVVAASVALVILLVAAYLYFRSRGAEAPKTDTGAPAVSIAPEVPVLPAGSASSQEAFLPVRTVQAAGNPIPPAGREESTAMRGTGSAIADPPSRESPSGLPAPRFVGGGQAPNLRSGSQEARPPAPSRQRTGAPMPRAAPDLSTEVRETRGATADTPPSESPPGNPAPQSVLARRDATAAFLTGSTRPQPVPESLAPEVKQSFPAAPPPESVPSAPERAASSPTRAPSPEVPLPVEARPSASAAAGETGQSSRPSAIPSLVPPAAGTGQREIASPAPPPSSPSRAAEVTAPGRPTAAPSSNSTPANTAVAVSKVAPVYPEAARRMRLSGRVELEVAVDEQGRVRQATPLTGSPLLHAAAVDAVMKWRFKPATLNGKNVASRGTVFVQFSTP